MVAQMWCRERNVCIVDGGSAPRLPVHSPWEGRGVSTPHKAVEGGLNRKREIWKTLTITVIIIMPGRVKEHKTNVLVSEEDKDATNENLWMAAREYSLNHGLLFQKHSLIILTVFQKDCAKAVNENNREINCFLTGK